jgi:hypothetical protein
VKNLFNLLILGSLPTGGFFFLAGLATQIEKSPLKSPYFSLTIPRTGFAENPLKFPKIHIIPPKSVKFPKNIDELP